MNTLKALGVVIVCTAAIIAAQRMIGKAKPRIPPRGGGEAAVQVARVQSRDFSDRIEAVGTAKANESVTITANVSEQVEKVLFEEGASVEAGTLLVKLRSQEEEALLREARVDASEQRRELNRVIMLREKHVQTQQKLDQQECALREAEQRLLAAEAVMRDRRIVAPFSGVLGIREISPGALVQPGTTITTLDDISQIKLDFTVPEIYLASLKKGLLIQARSVAFPDRSFSGVVSIISPRVNPTTRAVQVQALIPNPERLLRPGMLLTVKLTANPRKSVSVPEACLVAYGKKQFVYVMRKDGTVEKREVHIGRREIGNVEVSAGLQPGETVVTEGVMNLRDGAKVRIVGKDKTSRASVPRRNGRGDDT